MGWAPMRTSWGTGERYVGFVSVWNFLLVVNKTVVEPMATLIRESGYDDAPMHLLATRVTAAHEEHLFLPRGRRFVYVTDFHNREYAVAFTEELAKRELGADWDGEWTGGEDDLLDRVDARMKAMS